MVNCPLSPLKEVFITFDKEIRFINQLAHIRYDEDYNNVEACFNAISCNGWCFHFH